MKVFLTNILLFLSFWISTIHITLAQGTHKIKLSEKLTQLEQQHNVNFSYNHSIFDVIELDRDFNCDSIVDCLAKIQKIIPISIKNSSVSNYMLIPNRKNISFKAIDIETDEVLPVLEYQINNKTLQSVFAENGVFTLQNVFPLDSIKLHSYFYKSSKFQAKDLLKTPVLHLSLIHI